MANNDGPVSGENQNVQDEALGAPKPPVKGQVSELAPSKGGADIDDGQDFDPRSDAVNEIGANDEDIAKNRGVATGPGKRP